MTLPSKNRLSLLGSVVLPAIALSFAASTYGLEMTSETAGYDPGVPIALSDIDTASSGSVSATVSMPDSFGGGDPTATASQMAVGVGAIGGVSIVNGNWANGLVGNFLAAENRFTETVAVDGDYEFSFTTTAGQLELIDYAFVNAGDLAAPFAKYTLDMAVNGSSVFHSSVTYMGGKGGRNLTKSGVDFGGSYSAIPDSIFFYNINAYSSTLNLGSLVAGDVFSYSLSVSSGAAGYELGANAYIGDPNNLSTGGNTLSGLVATSRVPDSSVFSAFGLTLVGLAFARRRLKS